MSLQPVDIINAIGSSNLDTMYQNIKQQKSDANAFRRGSNSSVSSNGSTTSSQSGSSGVGDAWWSKSQRGPKIDATSAPSISPSERSQVSRIFVAAREGTIQAFRSMKKSKTRSSISSNDESVDEASIFNRLPPEEQTSMNRRASIRDVNADAEAIQAEVAWNRVRESWARECNWLC